MVIVIPEKIILLLCMLLVVSVCDGRQQNPYIIVLGIAQDGGVPQAGDHDHSGWRDPARRERVVSLGLVQPATGDRWLFEATPDLPSQLRALMRSDPVSSVKVPNGVFVTHAHIGHYTGLMFFGHEVMGTRELPLHVMPRMAAFLGDNGPWSQLLAYHNVAIHELSAGHKVVLGEGLAVTPFPVPHRQEFSEVVGFRIDGPNRSVLFIPDIDDWSDWRERGTDLRDVLAEVDLAYLDGSFFANGELPGRDMSQIPHPEIRDTMRLLDPLPESERSKVRFIHLNHSNPALRRDSAAHREIIERGYRVAAEGDIEPL